MDDVLSEIKSYNNYTDTEKQQLFNSDLDKDRIKRMLKDVLYSVKNKQYIFKPPKGINNIGSWIYTPSDWEPFDDFSVGNVFKNRYIRIVNYLLNEKCDIYLIPDVNKNCYILKFIPK